MRLFLLFIFFAPGIYSQNGIECKGAFFHYDTNNSSYIGTIVVQSDKKSIRIMDVTHGTIEKYKSAPLGQNLVYIYSLNDIGHDMILEIKSCKLQAVINLTK